MNAGRTGLFLLLVTVGCGAPSADQDKESPSDSKAVARTKIERGPVRVEVTVEPHPARLSDEPTLTVTIDYQRGVDVEKPPFGESIGGFGIRDFREPLPETGGDREIIRQIYTLEPTQTGKLQIAPITVAFTDNRDNGDGKKHTVETEALEVEVKSVLESELPSLDDLEGIAGPVELPKPQQSSDAGWWILLMLTIVEAVLIAIWLKRRRKAVVERTYTPQELAYLELQQLIRANLSETDIKEFYVQLTGIVRRYIERTTQIHAPEQTTEEFLRDIANGSSFSRDEQTRLKLFLESADLVKFAAHEPTNADIEETFERAKVFIGLESQGVAA